jgi:hypothetical protein
VLTDGEWNAGGDPLGGPGAVSLLDGVGNGSVITYSRDSGAKLYVIGLGVTSGYQTILTNYATQGNGKYYNAPNSSQLAQIYHEIAGELKTEAGVDTTAEMDMQTLTLNGESIPGIDALTYINDTVPTEAPGSTWIHKFNVTHTSLNYTFSQTPEWNLNQKLTFDVTRIGTIHINESWETNVRFKLLKMGNIELFNGTSSCIKFNDTQSTGTNQLCLPNVSVIGQPNWSVSFTTQTIKLNNLRSTATGELTNELPLSWDTTYTGNATVTEQFYYMQNGAGGWVKFGEISGITKGVTASNTVLPITSLPPGGYQIKVYATASDAPDDTITLPDAITLGGAGKYYIKLE